MSLYGKPLDYKRYGGLPGELVTVGVTYERVLRYHELFIIMTRGAGSLRCSGILLDAGPLVEDRDVQDVANRFRAAAAPRPCAPVHVVLHRSLA